LLRDEPFSPRSAQARADAADARIKRAIPGRIRPGTPGKRQNPFAEPQPGKAA